ncbi:MAG: DUF2147 domain-containing protein [Bacteroidota bacterium]
MMRNLFALTALLLVQTLSAQNENRLLIGTWEPIGSEKHLRVQVYENQRGQIEGRVIEAGADIAGFENGVTAGNSRIITGFRHTGAYIWKEGEITDPEDGDVYTGKITLMHSTKIEVRAYWGIFSKTQEWRKVTPTVNTQQGIASAAHR